jgi:allantoin racemase
MTRITVVNPNTSVELTATITKAAQAVAGAGVTVTGVHPALGVPSVESHAEEAIAAVGVIEQVRAHQRGTDAFVIACFGDTGVAAAREVATCPVVGMTEAALQTACLVAHRFVVITLPARTIAHSDRVVRALGLEHRCTVTAVDVAVAELVDGSTHLLDAFAEAARTADQAGTAEAVVLGCAGLADLVDPLSDRLGVPVIDGVAAGVGIAAGLVAMGLNTSRASTYAPVHLEGS